MRLVPPAGHDWDGGDPNDPDDVDFDYDHEVRFGAGESEKTLRIGLFSGSPDNVGFASAATRSGTLVAGIDAVRGYNTADTADVEVLVERPAWIFRLLGHPFVFTEGDGPRELEVEACAASPEIPPPSEYIGGGAILEVGILTDSGTASSPGDYPTLSEVVPFPSRVFAAGADGIQCGRASFAFTPVRDDVAEPAETMSLIIQKTAGVSSVATAYESADGSRDLVGNYPVTIVDANSPATGAPGIEGTARAGETLRATIDGIADPDGISGADFGYRWIRMDGADEEEIPGARSRAYIVTPADVGRRLRVEVSFSDDLGFAETVSSEAVAIREARLPASCPAFRTPEGHARLGAVTVAEVGPVRFAGTPIAYGWYEGGAILSRAGRIEVSGGSGGGSLEMLGQTYEVEGAYAGTAGSLVLNLDAPVSDAERARLVLHYCGEAYAFADADHDAITHAYTWRHAGLDWSGEASAAMHLSTDASVPTGAPSITGPARIGEALSAETNGIADPDGLMNPGWSYQWLRDDGARTEEIPGATGMTYTLVAEDVGRAVRVRVGFSDDRGIAKSAVSAAVAVGNTPAAGAPGLEGSARVGGRLTATTGGITDDNGLTAPVWSYQWFRADGEAETAIGTDAVRYRVVPEDLGSRVGVRVSLADDAGYAETVESVAVDVLARNPPTDSVCGGAAFSPPEGREELWRAEVIISGVTHPPAPGAGYHAGPPRQGGLTDGVNTLADRSFVLGSGSRHVVDIVMGRSGNGQLDFSLDSALTEADAGSLVLHVCGESFPFADAQHDPSGHTYSWPAGSYSVWQTQSAARWVFLSIPAGTGPGNRAPTGAPVIAGTARVGETLTALTDAIRDADGARGPVLDLPVASGWTGAPRQRSPGRPEAPTISSRPTWASG